MMGIMEVSEPKRRTLMPQRRTLTLTPQQYDELQQQRDHHPKPHVRERCAALLKIADGQSPHAVACFGLLRTRDPDTVYAWLAFYQEQGFAGLSTHQHGGNRRRSL
jgi:hypothetical protein